MGFILWLVTGLIAGWLAGKIMQGDGFGILWDLVLGLVGGSVGGWIMSLVDISANGWIMQIVVAAVGAIILVWLARLVRPKAFPAH